MLWDILRLSAKALWGSRINPVRPIVERQQALAVLGLPPDATHQQIKRRYRELAKNTTLIGVAIRERCSASLQPMSYSRRIDHLRVYSFELPSSSSVVA